MTDWSDRAKVLELGAAFRVSAEASTIKGNDLVEGEQLHLAHVGYSRYDGCYIYTFAATDGSTRQFWLGDEQPVQLLLRALLPLR